MERLRLPPFEDNFFSVISMIEVIEHLKNPKTISKYIYDKLKIGGVAVIQTADLSAHQAVRAGNSYHYYLPGHLSYYSESNLKTLFHAAGFKKIHFYRPVDFGLLAKLKKMRGSFTTASDYLRMIPTSMYHFKGYLRWRKVPLTSSMVMYAQK
jgi:2-polyprenyl-3-methyl-5-hydroxy-6-metoxy-1,4-benzoquinol methylase